MPKKKTREEFIEDAIKVHGNDYIYDKVNYINTHTKVCIICKKCGNEFWMTPHNHLYGGNGNHFCKGCGCPKCQHERVGSFNRKTREEFIEEARQIHYDNFDYSKVDYINSKTKVCIICKKCGNEFWQTPSSHLQGNGCRKCVDIATSERCRIWTKEKCMAIAQQYKSKKELRCLNGGAYYAMLKYGWIQECTAHCKDERLKIFGKCESIYCYRFLNINGSNYVYVGLTIDTLRRDQQHKNNKSKNTSSVFKFSELHNIEIPPIEILESNLTKNEAQIKEKEYCDKFTQDGYILINIGKTGLNTSSLGAINSKWTYQRCYDEAKKYKYIDDFEKKCGVCYNKSRKKGWIKDFIWLKYKTTHWTHQTVEEVAKKYTTLRDFRKYEGSAYSYARKHKLMQKFTWLKRQINLPNRMVLQIDKITNEIINEMEISVALKLFGRHITSVCNGKNKTCGGFKWKYKEED